MDLLKNNINEVLSAKLSSIRELETGRSLTSQSFKEAISLRMTFFNENHRLLPGHSVILFDNNTLDFFVDFLALFFLKVTVIPLDNKMLKSEVEAITASTGAKLIIRDGLVVNGPGSIQKSLLGIALILFTSGTTGSPKGVLISMKNLVKKIKVMQDKISSNELKNSLCFLPTFFGHGLICNSLLPLFSGETFTIAPTMSIKLAADFSQVIEKNNITFFSSVPSHWEMILQFAGIYQGKSLKRVHVASAPLRKDKMIAIKEWLGSVDLYDVYGATEMLGWFGATQITTTSECGLFDKFWEAEIKYSAEGELFIRADYMFSGYWQMEKNPEDYFFPTGDLFVSNRMIGRNKNVINKNGIKISSAAIDLFIAASGMTKNAASFPVDDIFLGEVVGVFVVLNSSYTLEQLKKYCRENMSVLNMPSEFIEVERIPVNSRGKISFNELRKAYDDYRKRG
jgi:acyl-CoA synthetase (AMP-forming)/AMP-acid ligase II